MEAKELAMDKESLEVEDATARARAQALGVTTYNPDQEILVEGEESPCFFVILSGRVRINRQGKRIRVLEEQDIFGLENLVFGKPSPYAVHALDKCRIAKYGGEYLDVLIRESPRMVQMLLKSTLHQLTQTSTALLHDSDSLLVDDVVVRFLKDGEGFEVNPRQADFFRLVSTHRGLRVTIGGQEVARIDKPGEFFGGMPGLVGFPERAVLASIGESVVEVYRPDNLDMLIRDYPGVAQQVLRAFVTGLEETGSKPAEVDPAVDSSHIK